MSTTRTLITILTLALAAPAAVPGSQRPVVAIESPERRPSIIQALSPDEPTEAPPERPAPVAAPALPIVVRMGRTVVRAERGDQVSMVVWSLARFAEAGLALPGVAVDVWSPGSCPGEHAGWMADLPDGSYGITICAYERTALHELAHVWDRVTLDAERRAAYLDERGLVAWRHEVWHLAGGEHAAETITWALDDTYWPPSRIDQNSCEALARGYQILTGATAPILDRYPLCDTPDGTTDIAGPPPEAAGSVDEMQPGSSGPGATGATNRLRPRIEVVHQSPGAPMG